MILIKLMTGAQYESCYDGVKARDKVWGMGSGRYWNRGP